MRILLCMLILVFAALSCHRIETDSEDTGELDTEKSGTDTDSSATFSGTDSDTISEQDTTVVQSTVCESWEDCNNYCCGCHYVKDCINGSCVRSDEEVCFDASCCGGLWGCGPNCEHPDFYNFDGTCQGISCGYDVQLESHGCYVTDDFPELYVTEGSCGVDAAILDAEMEGICIQSNQPGSSSELCGDVETVVDHHSTTFTGCCTTENLCSIDFPPYGCLKWDLVGHRFGMDKIGCTYEE